MTLPRCPSSFWKLCTTMEPSRRPPPKKAMLSAWDRRRECRFLNAASK